MTSTTQSIPDLVHGRILGLSAFLTLPVAIFVPKGMVVLFVLTALLSCGASMAHKRKGLIATGWGASIAVAFTILSLGSAIWSMTPEASLKKALVLGLVIFGGLVLTFAARRLQEDGRRVFETSLIAGGVSGFSILAIEVAFNSPLYALLLALRGLPPETPLVMLSKINQGAAVAAIYLLPWTLAVRRRMGAKWAGAGFAIGVAVLAFCQADSHKAALVVGLASALIVFVGGRPALKGFSVLFVVGVLSAPWVVTMLPDPLQLDNAAAFLPKSSQHRLVIWRTTAEHIFERPFSGSGLDTARAFYDRDQKVVYYFGGKGAATGWTNSFEPIPLHPHNGILQVWLELGVVGALLLAAAIYFMVARLAAHEGGFERAVIFGAFVTGLMVFTISYGAWQSWWMGTVWLMMVFGAASCQGKMQ